MRTEDVVRRLLSTGKPALTSCLLAFGLSSTCRKLADNFPPIFNPDERPTWDAFIGHFKAPKADQDTVVLTALLTYLRYMEALKINPFVDPKTDIKSDPFMRALAQAQIYDDLSAALDAARSARIIEMFEQRMVRIKPFVVGKQTFANLSYVLVPRRGQNMDQILTQLKGSMYSLALPQQLRYRQSGNTVKMPRASALMTNPDASFAKLSSGKRWSLMAARSKENFLVLRIQLALKTAMPLSAKELEASVRAVAKTVKYP